MTPLASRPKCRRSVNEGGGVERGRETGPSIARCCPGRNLGDVEESGRARRCMSQMGEETLTSWTEPHRPGPRLYKGPGLQRPPCRWGRGRSSCGSLNAEVVRHHRLATAASPAFTDAHDEIQTLAGRDVAQRSRTQDAGLTSPAPSAVPPRPPCPLGFPSSATFCKLGPKPKMVLNHEKQQYCFILFTPTTLEILT